MSRSLHLQCQSQLGFSLLELVLVLALIGVIAGISVGSLAPLRHGQVIEQSVRRLGDQIVHCQMLASKQAQIIRLRIDLDAKRMQVHALPDDSQALSTEHDFIDNAALRLSFFDLSGTEQQNGVIDLLFLPDQRCDKAGYFVFHLHEQAMQLTCFQQYRPPRMERVL